ncbi:MAG: InlB B-repeat-containing protein, partial [Christensenellales bacterium]
MQTDKIPMISDFAERKKVFATKALLLIIFAFVFAVFVTNTVLFSYPVQDLSYLDDSAVQGYKNGSYINDGDYYVGMSDGSAHAAVSETDGTAAKCATVSGLTNSYSLSSVAFSSSNVYFTEYASGNWDGRTNTGTGKFGWSKGGATGKQGTVQNSAYIYVELTGNMLTLAKAGRLKVSLSGTYGAESGDDQTLCYGMTYASSLTKYSVTSSISAFQNQMKVNSGSQSTTDAGTWDASLSAMNITDASSYSNLYLVIAVTGHTEYGGFIGGRVPSAYLENITLNFGLQSNFNITFNKATGGTIDKTSATISTVAGTASCTAAPGPGYIWTNWTKGTTTTEATTSATLTVNAINCLSYTTYKANFTAITYTIAFNFMGKTINGSFPNQTVTGSNESAVLGAPTSTGNAFAGWMRTSTQTTVDYTADTKIKPCNLNTTKEATVTITLYALWQAATATAGTGITSITASPTAYSMYEDVTYTVTASKSGYILDGVYATYTSGELQGVSIDLVQNDAGKWVLYGICGNCTLYPRWRANSSYNVTQCKITFNANGGTLYKPDGTSVSSFVFQWLYGEAYSHAYFPYATRSGYTFCGWTTEKDGSTFVNSISTTTKYTNQTLYAKWVSNTLVSSTWAEDRRSFGNNTASSWTEQGSKSVSADLSSDIKNILNNLSSYYNIGYSFNITSSFRTDSATAQNGWTSTSYYSETKYVINGTDKAYTKIDEGGSGSGGTKAGTGTSATHGHSKMDGDSYRVTGTNVAAYAVATGTIASTATSLSYTISRQYKHAAGSSYSVTYCATCNAGNFHYWSSIGYSISLTGATRKGTKTNSVEIVYNPNGATGSAYRHRVASGTNVSLAPSNFWDRPGYHFAGWGTSASASSAITGTVNISSDTNYYAIWVPNQYPIITYDVYTDNVNKQTGATSHYGVEIRKEGYYKYNTAITLNTDSTNSVGKIGSGAGGNTYTGFSNTGWYKITTNPSKSNAWTYAAGTSATSIAADTTIGPKYAYYLRNMNAPAITITGQSAVYGLSGIDLEASGKITKTLDLGTRSVSFDTVWYKGTGSTTASFYVSDVPVIYTCAESGTYACGLIASTTIGGATLSTYKKSGTAEYAIQQLSLALAYDGSNVVAYNGQSQKFMYKVVVDT